MKKLILLVLALVTCTSAFGQGSVTFANNAASLVTTNGTVFGGGAGTADTTAGVRLQLYYVPGNQAQPDPIYGQTGLFIFGTWQPLGAVATLSSPGRFNAGN